MSRTYVVLVCPACRRPAVDCELPCACSEAFDGLEPIALETVAIDDPRIIVPPTLGKVPTAA